MQPSSVRSKYEKWLHIHAVYDCNIYELVSFQLVNKANTAMELLSFG